MICYEITSKGKMKMDGFVKYIIKNWEPIVAIAGLLLSILNTIIISNDNKKAISIKELFYLVMESSGKYIYEFNMIIVNKSKQPLSIVGVSFESNGKTYCAKPDKTVISEKKGKGEVIKFYSAEFPINLAGLQSTKEILQFKLDEKLEDEEINLKISTSRGIIKKTINYKDKETTPEEYLHQLF